MFKKITAVCLLLALLLCAVSCAKDEDQTPEGMKLASKTGEPFRLYVPEAWTLNTTSGISGACLYYTTESVSTLVTARFATLTDATETLTDYVNRRTAVYTETVQSFAVTARRDVVLSEQPALQVDYTAIINGTAMTCREIVAFYKGDAISLHWYVATELYESMAESLKQIEKEFVLCDKSVPNDAVTDKHTPDGMKIASSDSIEYCLYVPASWIGDSTSGKSEAYVAADRSNVTVTSYSPSTSMSVADYFNLAEASYKTELSGYELLATDPLTVAERDATSYTYKAVYDGVEYRIRQTILAYNEIIYSITYTAKADCFDAHLGDADAILSAFRFR